MINSSILDFRAQAEQMLRIIEARLKDNERHLALQLLLLKFKGLYEQGILSGRIYEKDGIYPYSPYEDTDAM